MDIIELIPVIIVALGAVASAAWVVFKVVAKFTKTTKDDEFIEEHGEAVEDALDKLEGGK